jgi:hypothetical protein
VINIFAHTPFEQKILVPPIKREASGLGIAYVASRANEKFKLNNKIQKHKHSRILVVP